MKIEVSHHKHWSYLDYAEGELYCSMIIIDGKDDWRMATLYETDFLMSRGVLYNVQRKNYKKIKLMINDAKWYQPIHKWLLPDFNRIKWVIPVRNV